MGTEHLEVEGEEVEEFMKASDGLKHCYRVEVKLDRLVVQGVYCYDFLVLPSTS